VVEAIIPKQIADYLRDPEVRELAGVVLGSIDPDARRLVVEFLADAVMNDSGDSLSGRGH
jgi:hypothetical protein